MVSLACFTPHVPCKRGATLVLAQARDPFGALSGHRYGSRGLAPTNNGGGMAMSKKITFLFVAGIVIQLFFIITVVNAFDPVHLKKLQTSMDCSRCDLSGANLANMDLSNMNLQGANLSGAMLAGTNFWDANLSDATLRGASISKTNFEGANLSNAIWVDGTKCKKGARKKCK
ncbi:pentapeptide repeat-containing protein [Syntrophorhabdus aromaticivorans]|jgi:hypothetical protein|nr:pentapeptide repeat-containing protein [Syntrophorhabdus aromaticivorans]HBA54244.1 pentapeptide repeat-containing protein [Syntrophorhabdus aromaticivorans]